MTKHKDISGAKIGRLTLIKMVIINHNTSYECICDCGNKKSIRYADIKSGDCKSCGCYRKELKRKWVAEARTTHGMTNTITYSKWTGMLSRCYNKNFPAYINYGARGITVCSRWRHSFENFFLDMGEAPAGKTLERINNNRNYYPKNCKWATNREQNRNKRNNVWISFRGEKKILADWAKFFGKSAPGVRLMLKIKPVNEVFSKWLIDKNLSL